MRWTRSTIALVRRIVELTEELEVGDPSRRDVDLGPLTTKGQRDIVVEHVADAVAKGARVLTGGEMPDGPGYYYPPTVLVDVTDDMVMMHEETFGPTMPICRVRDLDEAVEKANDSRFGLTASGFTTSPETAARLQRDLAAGAVGINEHGIVAAGEVTGSWGGLGESGIGRAHGPFGLHELVNIKYVFTDPGDDDAAPWHYPYDEDFGQFIGAAMPYLYKRGSRQVRPPQGSRLEQEIHQAGQEDDAAEEREEAAVGSARLACSAVFLSRESQVVSLMQ